MANYATQFGSQFPVDQGSNMVQIDLTFLFDFYIHVLYTQHTTRQTDSNRQSEKIGEIAI